MGEHYNWVNVDRKEYISSNDFNFGNKDLESSQRGSGFLCALRELLGGEWKGCHILLMGDEKRVSPDEKNETLRILSKQIIRCDRLGEEAYETIFDTYRNISCLFKLAEKEVRRKILLYQEERRDNIQCHNEYGVDPDEPYHGLFLREGRDFRYTVNHTKGICYSFDCTKILCPQSEWNDQIDPLPFLMGCGRSLETGKWVGDIIGVADEMPEGYELLKEIPLDW